MKNKYFFALAILCGMALGLVTACSETDNELIEYPNWEKRNVAYFDSIYNVAIENRDGMWDTIRCWSMSENNTTLSRTNYIVVHKEEVGTGSGCPLYSDSVLVHNQGKLLPSTSHPQGYFFEKSYEGDFDSYNPLTARAKKWAVNILVDGYVTALQHMHIGDRWRVYMPWTMGYGTTDYNGIPAYSVLIWDIKLLGYYHPGAVVPDQNAKDHASSLWTME